MEEATLAEVLRARVGEGNKFQLHVLPPEQCSKQFERHCNISYEKGNVTAVGNVLVHRHTPP